LTCPKCSHEYDTIVRTIGTLEYTFPISCPKCAEEQRQKLDLEAKQEAIKAENERIKRWISYADFPPRYATMRSYEPISDVQSREWDYRTPLILLGGVGSGKTKWAVWQAILGICKYNKTARYIEHSALVSKIEAAKNFKSFQDVDSTIKEFVECDILILDEVDKQDYTSHLFRVIGGRYDANKPTIFIANIGVDAFKKILGDALYSRIAGQGCKTAINFGVTDFRRES